MRLLFFGDFSYDFDFVAEDIRLIGDLAREREAKVILNLEGAMTEGDGTKIRKRGKHLPQKGKCREALTSLGVSGVALANNHIMDFSERGLRDTLTALDDMGIKHTGAGLDMNEALKPIEFTEGDETVAIFNFGWDMEETVYAGLHKSGCAPRREELIFRTIGEYSGKYPESKVIVVFHWGFEYNPYPLPFDVKLAHDLCEMDGVYAIIGHHSHCPQPFEVINGKPVFYSLGNFYYSSRRHKYSARRFNFDPPNLCDYCIAAFIDTVEDKAEPLVFYYDLDQDRIEYREDFVIPVSMPEADYRTEEYRTLARRAALHKTPVPGVGKWENRIAFFKFNLKRNLGKYLGRLKSS